MPKAQEWLDLNYPKDQRNKITKLDLRSESLEGKLVIENWPNLERLDCGFNQLTNVKISNLPKLNFFSARNCQLSNLSASNCPEIGYFNVKKNSLSDLSSISNLNPEKLTFLDVGDNSFSEQDLSVFSNLINLEEIYFGNSFSDSLEPLKNLTKLKNLGIFTPNIDSGLEYLSASLERIYCHNLDKDSDTSLSIWEEVKNYPIEDSFKFTCYDYQAWRENNAERIESAIIDKITLIKQIKELQAKINHLEKQKVNLEILFQKNLSNINIGSLSLYSGDIITLQAENGRYLKKTQSSSKNFFKKEKEVTIQTAEINSLDEDNYFIVEVIENNKIRLRTLKESLYCKIYDEKDKENPIYFTNDVDEATIFLINGNERSNKVTLQLVNNKKKYLGLKENKFIVAKEKIGERGKFLLNKETNYQKKIEGCREVIEDIKFHVERKKEISEQSAQELTQKNYSNESQKYTLNFSREYTKEDTYDWGLELSTGVETKVGIGVPLLVEGGVSLKLETKVSSGSSYTQSKTETITGSLEVTCPENSMVVAEAILEEYDLEVPITTTISRYLTDKLGNESKYTYQVDGKFKGRYAKAFVKYEKAIPLIALENKIEQPPKYK